MAAQKKSGDADAPVLWERIERPTAAPRASLTPQKIAAVAVQVADTEGFAAVTMRRLATELGVAPMAAYRHVSGKDDLWALMVDQVTAELAVPDEATGWRDILHAYATASRAMMLRHPWLAQLPTQHFVLTPNRMAIAERQLAALDGHGMDTDSVMAAFRAVNAYVHGAAQSEVALRQYMEDNGWASGDETRRALAPQMTYLMETGRYPTYRRYTLGAGRKDDAAWQFETGLDCVLDGIAARIDS
ncbi:TetR/AcrR family transcriptional regulator [Streptomyces sp. NPDC056149]|uniref:TetR/AcrR family transcriptional regulator n=1 Tax=unclassified Streptomyces TaxID=2593676 RepID=UPI00238175EA|nr:TetR/AcrR family transcriptional regulator C-terminal domain-containing protein [Streptomyces sp. WZ-12]